MPSRCPSSAQLAQCSLEPVLSSTHVREEIIALAARHSLPAMYVWPEAADNGGLMSYGTSQRAAYRQADVDAGRILNGEKPADLPVIESSKLELVINLKTAKSLGLEVPPALWRFVGTSIP